MLVRDELSVHPRLRRLLEGPFGVAFRWAFAVMFAGIFGAMIAGLAAPVVIPQLPMIATLACPAGHRVTQATTQEIYPQGGAGGRSRPVWLACRDETGRVLPSPQPHFAILQTAWLLTAFALFRPMRLAMNFLLLPASLRREP